MLNGRITLRDFAEHELIFDEGETRHILKFFFRHLQGRIDVVKITKHLRSFAQAILVEAIDATYALGYLEILWRASNNPGVGMAAVLKKLGLKSAVHWFKNATRQNLLNSKISSRVRDKLAYNFSSVFPMMLDETVGLTDTKRILAAYIQYGQASKNDVIWG